jgi:hypothetical protein
MTKKQIVEETLSYYEKDPGRRAIHPETGDCMYNLKDKGGLGKWNGKYKHCAVGRCLDEKYKMFGEALPGNYDSDSVDVTALANKITDAYSLKTKLELDDLLDPKYRGHEIGFWKQLQQLHDREDYWSDISSGYYKTSNKRRKEKVQIILDNYPDGGDK